MLLPDVRLLNASDLVFDAKDSILVVDVLALLALGHNLLPLSALAREDPHVRVLCGVAHVETVSSRAEDGVAHCTLL